MELQRNKARFEQANAQVIALTTDSPAKNLRVAQGLGVTMPILSDPQGVVLKKLEAWDARWKIAGYGFFVIDRNLRITAQHRGSWDPTPQAIQWMLDRIAGKKDGSS